MPNGQVGTLVGLGVVVGLGALALGVFQKRPPAVHTAILKSTQGVLSGGDPLAPDMGTIGLYRNMAGNAITTATLRSEFAPGVFRANGFMFIADTATPGEVDVAIITWGNSATVDVAGQRFAVTQGSFTTKTLRV